MDVGVVSANGITDVALTATARPAEKITFSSPAVDEPGKISARSSLAAQNTANAAEPTPAQLKQMVQEMQSHLDSMNVSLQYFLYGTHENKVAVKVINKDTGKVIREIPPKEMQALQTKMGELVGMIFDKNA